MLPLQAGNRKDAWRFSSGDRRGFTLLELLVAMAILSMIVLMMVGVFHQSRVAWEIGLRKARLSMEGRTVANFMASELSQAVADNTLPCAILNGAPAIAFYTLANPNGANRAIQRVAYAQAGNDIKRSVWKIPCAGLYPGPVGAPDEDAIIARNLDAGGLQFFTSDSADHSTNLPSYVEIKLKMKVEEKVTKFRAGSAGPDKVWGTGDDIWSDQ